MPFIHTQTNVRVSEEKEAAIKEKLGLIEKGRKEL